MVGNLNLRDLLLELCIGNILLFVKLTFDDFNMKKPSTNLMVVKYDKFKNVMFWEDSKKGQHDITKCEDNEKVSYIKDKLNNASEIYVFELSHYCSTMYQNAGFTDPNYGEKHTFAPEVVKGEVNNSANHIYNIVKNRNYNSWTDPSTGKGSNANIYGWHHTLENIV